MPSTCFAFNSSHGRTRTWQFNGRTDALPPRYPAGKVNTVSEITRGGSSSDEDGNLRDGPSQYSLVGFISHMGSNANSGHYVCHLLKDEKWIIFNDEKVALSEKPPKELAYIFLLKRRGVF